MLNVRSIGDDTKSGQIHDFDCLASMETWLHLDDRSQQQIGDITGTGLSFHHKPRKGRKGRGVGVIARTALNIEVLPHSPFSSFEHIELSIATCKAHVHLIVIYCPPPSKKNGLSVSTFLSEFTMSLESVSTVPGHSFM